MLLYDAMVYIGDGWKSATSNGDTLAVNSVARCETEAEARKLLDDLLPDEEVVAEQVRCSDCVYRNVLFIRQKGSPLFPDFVELESPQEDDADKGELLGCLLGLLGWLFRVH